MFVAGIDGCRKGWFAVMLENHRGATEIFPTDDFEALRNLCSLSDLVLIDIPIGLPEKGERLCDVEARKILGKRRMSVFPVPCRGAVYAESYEKAVEINLKVSGRKVSKQLWNITPKIRSVDEFLRKSPLVREVLKESHPEICFWSISGRAMEHNKKREAGINERLELIKRIFPEGMEIYRQALKEYRRTEVGRDDVIDALIMAVSARMALKHGIRSLPEKPETDGVGLEMQIVYAKLPVKSFKMKTIIHNREKYGNPS